MRRAAQTIADARARIAAAQRAHLAICAMTAWWRCSNPMASPMRARATCARSCASPNRAMPPRRNCANASTWRRITGCSGPARRSPMRCGNGARGPEMVVVPHGGFRMGAGDGEADASDSERPGALRPLRSRLRDVAHRSHGRRVPPFRRRQAATARPRRGAAMSLVYEERSGNFVRRSGIDWQSGYDGAPAGDDLPVVHVSARDAEAYAEWLGEQSGERYRLPSEAEFEYALRAGSSARYPWGEGTPPAGAGDLTGADRPFAGRPPLEQCVRGLWRWLLGPGAGRAFRRQCIRPSRPGRQCQRMGRRLLARRLSARARTTVRHGSIPVAARACCVGAPGRVHRRRRARPGARRSTRCHQCPDRFPGRSRTLTGDARPATRQGEGR